MKAEGNLIILITGKPGTGKTMSGLSLAAGLNPFFTDRQIITSVEGIMETVKASADECIEKNNLHACRGRVIVYEETQEQQYKMKSNTTEAVAFVEMLSTVRSLGMIFIMTTPYGSHLQRNLLDYVDIWLNTLSINASQKLCYLNIKYIERGIESGKLYKKFPVITYGGANYFNNIIAINLPPTSVGNTYQFNKLKFQAESYKGKIEKIKRKYKINKKQPLVCPHCNYNWIPIKKNPEYCPGCRKKLSDKRDNGV